jgi:indoleamine 2,3-dioxygenase
MKPPVAASVEHKAIGSDIPTRRDGSPTMADLRRGFLPESDPCPRLPAPFDRWDELGAALPKLLACRRVGQVIEGLVPLDPDGLSGPALERAMMLLSFLGHAYIWEDWRDAPRARIPSGIAVPWHAVATRLGRPPVLSYASYALDNWRRLDPAGPIDLGNIALLQNFLGGLDEEWFVAVHVAIEARAANLVHAIPKAQQAVADGDARALEAQLGRIADTLEQIVATLARMPERCDPYVYYHRVRPYIHGFTNHPVVYEGVDAYGATPRRFHGETGAQSTIVPLLDAALGIRHAPDELTAYLRAMREYMPPAHRSFLATVESGPSIMDFVRESGGGLVDDYEACVRLLADFRSRHLEFAATYIHRQAEQGANSTHYGTGGTPFMAYLQKHRDETRAAGRASVNLIDENPSA